MYSTTPYNVKQQSRKINSVTIIVHITKFIVTISPFSHCSEKKNEITKSLACYIQRVITPITRGSGTSTESDFLEIQFSPSAFFPAN